MPLFVLKAAHPKPDLSLPVAYQASAAAVAPASPHLLSPQLPMSPQLFCVSSPLMCPLSSCVASAPLCPLSSRVPSVPMFSYLPCPLTPTIPSSPPCPLPHTCCPLHVLTQNSLALPLLPLAPRTILPSNPSFQCQHITTCFMLYLMFMENFIFYVVLGRDCVLGRQELGIGWADLCKL